MAYFDGVINTRGSLALSFEQTQLILGASACSSFEFISSNCWLWV